MLRVRSFFIKGISLLVSLSLILVGCGSSSPGSPSSSPSSSPGSPGTLQSTKYKHIFYIMMENHATNQIIGNTADAPYLNQPASQYGVAMSYFGVTHPSLPNYLAAISGDRGCCKSPTGVGGVILGGANTPAIIITSKGPHHILVSDTSYNHYSLLGTIEKLWGLGCLANTCDFNDAALMTEFFE